MDAPSFKYNKGVWSQEEDNLLRFYVEKKLHKISQYSYGDKLRMRWGPISGKVKTRSSKQCRERWINHLSPEICKGKWEPEEDEVLLRLGQKCEGKWAWIARHLPGRSQNQVKVRWKSLTRAKKKQKISFDNLDKSFERVAPVHSSFSEKNYIERFAVAEPFKNCEQVDDSCERYQDFNLDSSFENSVLELLMNIS